MIEFNDIDFRPNRPEMPPMHHRPEPHHPEHHHPCPPPFDPELKRVFDLAVHADHVAHKALDVASYANLDATAAKKLTEQTLVALNNVTRVANEANLKANDALANIDLLRSQARDILAKLNKTQKGAGLAEDGSYVKDDSTNYIKDATSLADADKKLDEALKEANTSIETLQEEVEALQEKVDGYEDLFEQLGTIQKNIIKAVGLKDTGNYKKSENSLINTADSVLKATEMLAEEISELSTQVGNAVTTEALNTVKNQINQQLEGIATDVQNVDTKANNVERRVDVLESSMGPTHVLAEEANRRVGLVERRVDNLATTVGNKVGSVTLENTGNLQYTLKVDGIDAGTINIPEDQYLNQVTYNPETKQLIFKFIDGSTVPVSIQDFVKEYTAGNGISISGNQISAVVSPSSEKNTNGVGFLTSIDNGIKIDGVKEEINAAYVAGNGLVRTGRIQDDPHIIFAVQVEENTKPYLTAQPTGLRLDVDALKAEIGGGDQFDCDRVVECIINSDTFNQWLTTKINQAVEAAMLWQINPNDTTAIQPKESRNVYVSGTIEATGAIYSGQD